MSRRRAVVAGLAGAFAFAALLGAATGPPAVAPPASAALDPDVRPDFRYRPGMAFDTAGAAIVAYAGGERWEGQFTSDDDFDIVVVELPTGRHYLSYSLFSEVRSAVPAALECRLVEAQSGITLEPQSSTTVRSLDGAVSSQREAVFDLPAMSVALTCSPESLMLGAFEVRQADLSALPLD